MLLSTNRAHSIGQHNTVFAHLIVSCVGCRVPYACLRFVCGACNTILTCRSGEMGRGWAFHGPPPSRHSLSSGECTHSRAPGAALRQHSMPQCNPSLGGPRNVPGTIPKFHPQLPPSIFLHLPPSICLRLLCVLSRHRKIEGYGQCKELWPVKDDVWSCSNSFL